MVAPDATNSPVPIEPPMAIMVRWRARSVRRSVGAGAPEVEGWLDIGTRVGTRKSAQLCRGSAAEATRPEVPPGAAARLAYRPVYTTWLCGEIIRENAVQEKPQT
ncbi:hypothetical protein D9M70_408870 [compost metagenome]